MKRTIFKNEHLFILLSSIIKITLIVSFHSFLFQIFLFYRMLIVSDFVRQFWIVRFTGFESRLLLRHKLLHFASF